MEFFNSYNRTWFEDQALINSYRNRFVPCRHTFDCVERVEYYQDFYSKACRHHLVINHSIDSESLGIYKIYNLGNCIKPTITEYIRTEQNGVSTFVATVFPDGSDSYRKLLASFQEKYLVARQLDSNIVVHTMKIVEEKITTWYGFDGVTMRSRVVEKMYVLAPIYGTR